MFASSYFVFVCKVKSWLHYPTYYRTFYQTYLVFLLPWLWKRIPMSSGLPLWSTVSSKTAVFVWQLVPYYEIFHNFQFRICVPVSKKKYESPDLSTKIKQTWPQWNKQGQTGSSCFPDCEKGFQCITIGATTDASGLGWVVNS